MTCKPYDVVPVPPSDPVTAVQQILLRALYDFIRTAGNFAWLLEEEARREQREEGRP